MAIVAPPLHSCAAELVRHVHRERNARADEFVRQGRDLCRVKKTAGWPPLLRDMTLAAWDPGYTSWHMMAEASDPLPKHSTGMDAEMRVLRSVVRFVHAMVRRGVTGSVPMLRPMSIAESAALARPKLWVTRLRMRDSRCPA